MIGVFGGLSVARADLATLSAAELLPPIARGDLGAAFDRGLRIFAIADGVFDQTSAVSPAEILEVMRLGARVFGSSSMGALRAAELDRHGMIGVGRIYELVCRSPDFRDDWLGHLFDPETSRLVTLPFVEVLGAIAAELDWDFGGATEIALVAEEATGARFDGITKRTTANLVAAIPPALRGPVGARLDAIWRDPAQSLKRRDARALIERVGAFLRDLEDDRRALRALEVGIGRGTDAAARRPTPVPSLAPSRPASRDRRDDEG